MADQWIARISGRYEFLLGASVLITLLWPVKGGLVAFVGGLALIFLVLDARSASQYKRNVPEDDTMIDRMFGRIPFRYEVLIGLAVVLAALWWLAAGMTGLVLGTGVVLLGLRARSGSQLKRGGATAYEEIVQ